MRIFIDANAFYSYFGRSKLGMNSEPVEPRALRQFLDKYTAKSLPTSAFIEIIVHFRNYPQVIKSFLRFIFDKHISLYNNIPDNPYIIDDVHLTALTSAPDDMLLKAYAINLLHKKINLECTFTLLFYEITRDLYAYYRLESQADLDQNEKNNILTFMAREGYKENSENLKIQLITELEIGYGKNEEEKVLKNFYITLLNEACTEIDLIISAFIACKNNEEDLGQALRNTLKVLKNKGMDGVNGTMPCIIDVLAQDKAFLAQAKARIATMFSKGQYTKEQCRYLSDVMFSAWFDRGHKLQKNDIFDMFCVGCLDAKDEREPNNILLDRRVYLISFDERMKKFIGSVNPENLSMIDGIK